jgi:type VII secretion integral membrane protein EccD
LTALATFSALAAAALAVGVVWTLPTAAVGAVLVTVSLVMLSTAARLIIAASSLTHVVDAARAVLAHQSLTGLVVGSSAAASLGTIMVAAGGWARGLLFTTAVGVVLLLRARAHADTSRRIALIAAGLIALTASFAAAVVSAPGHANWISILVAGAGLGASAWVFGGVTISPVVRRAVDVTEYLALAALVPLACWVIDLYGLVRGASLT